jgi:TPR repeat protein
MKRALLAISCYAFLLASPHSAKADAVFDQDMASRYLRAAQSGDDEAQFYMGSLYAAGVGVPRSDQEALRWFSRAADLQGRRRRLPQRDARAAQEIRLLGKREPR